VNNRRIICEAAFGFGPFDEPSEADWEELIETAAGFVGNPRLRSADWTVGRDNELEHFPAGTASVVLSNRDRALDPDNAASPHAGDLLPYVPVRIRSRQSFSVTSFARSSNTSILLLGTAATLNVGDTVVVDIVANDTFDGTFTVTGTDFFGSPAVLYTQVAADVALTAGGGTVVEVADEFYGYVRDGWEQQIGTNMSECRLELVDLLGVLAGYTLPDMFIYQLQQTSTLVGIWDLTESPVVEESVPDVSGFEHDGTVVGSVSFGERGTQPGHPSSALFEVQSAAFPDRDLSYIDLGRSQLLASSFSTSSVVATFKRRTAATSSYGVLFAHGNGNASLSGVALKVKPDGKIEYIYLTNGAGVNFQHPTPVDADFHCVIATGVGIALDEMDLDTTSTGGNAPKVNGAYIGGGRKVAAADHWDGWIGVVAIFDGNLGDTDREDIMVACEKLNGETSDTHIAWALDRIGVPASKRNIDVGTVFMGPAETKGLDALEWMRSVTETEGGSLYVDHRGGGKIRYTNRYHRFLASRSATSQATFSDQPGAVAVVRYPAEGLEVAPNGLDGIINQVTVTWRDGEVLVEDTTSIGAYGPRTRQIETQATTATQARSAGEWVVSRYAQPRSRIRGCTASARHTQQRDDRVQRTRVDDRVTFKIQPLHTGTVTTTDLYIDGISHSAHGVEWSTGFRFAQAETFTPWIWGTSAWNTTAYWG
jgi:hypothetical protein